MQPLVDAYHHTLSWHHCLLELEWKFKYVIMHSPFHDSTCKLLHLKCLHNIRTNTYHQRSRKATIKEKKQNKMLDTNYLYKIHPTTLNNTYALSKIRMYLRWKTIMSKLQYVACVECIFAKSTWVCWVHIYKTWKKRS